MTKTQMVRIILLDAAYGDVFPLMGLLDWLIYDKNIPLERILQVAERRFSLPLSTQIKTLCSIYN